MHCFPFVAFSILAPFLKKKMALKKGLQRPLWLFSIIFWLKFCNHLHPQCLVDIFFMQADLFPLWSLVLSLSLPLHVVYKPHGSSIVVLIWLLRSLMEDKVWHSDHSGYSSYFYQNDEAPVIIQQVLNGNYILVFGSPTVVTSASFPFCFEFHGSTCFALHLLLKEILWRVIRSGGVEPFDHGIQFSGSVVIYVCQFILFNTRNCLWVPQEYRK